MIIPILRKVSFSASAEVRRRRKGVGMTRFINYDRAGEPACACRARSAVAGLRHAGQMSR